MRALVARDFALAQWHHSPDFHLITPRGSAYSRESYLQAVEIGKIVYLKWEAASIVVRRFGNVALLRYQAELEMPSASGEPCRRAVRTAPESLATDTGPCSRCRSNSR